MRAHGHPRARRPLFSAGGAASARGPGGAGACRTARGAARAVRQRGAGRRGRRSPRRARAARQARVRAPPLPLRRLVLPPRSRAGSSCRADRRAQRRERARRGTGLDVVHEPDRRARPVARGGAARGGRPSAARSRTSRGRSTVDEGGRRDDRLHHHRRARREVRAEVRPRRVPRDRDGDRRDRRQAPVGRRVQRPRGPRGLPPARGPDHRQGRGGQGLVGRPIGTLIARPARRLARADRSREPDGQDPRHGLAHDRRQADRRARGRGRRARTIRTIGSRTSCGAICAALYMFFAWIDQTDVKEDNSLDMWVHGRPGGPASATT